MIVRLMFASALLAAALPAAAARPARHAELDWTMVAAETPDGGVRIGNPNARLKLVEYGSFTCPHCAAFAHDAFAAIRDRYVRSGRVSFEFRVALRDGADVAAAIVARCGAPQHYFRTAEAIFAAQPDWEQRAADFAQAHAGEAQPTDPATAVTALADALGLSALAQKQGVSPAQVHRCLADAKLRDTLAKAAADAWNVRQIGATPTFYLNNDKLDQVYGWTALEPYLRAKN